MKKKTQKWQALAVAAGLLFSVAATSVHAAAETKVGGVIFAQYLYNLSQRSGATNPGTAGPGALTDSNNAKGQSAFDVTRLFVTGETKFDDNWKSKFVIESRTEGPTAVSDENAVFLKGAYIERMNLLDAGANVQFGLIPGSWEAYEGQMLNRRYTGQRQYADLNGLANPWDKGVSVYGKLPMGFGDYNAQVTNGEGQVTNEGTTANTGRNKAANILLSIVPIPANDMLKGLRVHVYAQQEKQGIVDGADANLPNRERNRLFAGLAYKGAWGHVMGTYYSGNTANAAGTAHTRPKGYSVHGSFSALPMDMTVFARFDRLDAGVNEPAASAIYQPRYTTWFGIEKKMNENVRFAISDNMVKAKNKGGNAGGGTTFFAHNVGLFGEAKF